jgi:hypothetical protein
MKLRCEAHYAKPKKIIYEGFDASASCAGRKKEWCNCRGDTAAELVMVINSSLKARFVTI